MKNYTISYIFNRFNIKKEPMKNLYSIQKIKSDENVSFNFGNLFWINKLPS
jgi:hypothetical protein